MYICTYIRIHVHKYIRIYSERRFEVCTDVVIMLYLRKVCEYEKKQTTSYLVLNMDILEYRKKSKQKL